MRSDFGKVGVLLGGSSSERAISLKSGKAVARALRNRGVKVVEIGEDGDVKSGVLKQRIDLAFIALHGRFGEDGQVQHFLEEAGIPYTGSGVAASHLAMDKGASRMKFRQDGLTVPEFRLYRRGEAHLPPPFTGRLVIKPAREGSSIGLTIIRSSRGYEAACRTAERYDRQILVERYIPGRELTVGVLEDEALPVIEIVPKNKFFDFSAKYTEGRTEFILPAPLPEERYREVQAAALRAHRSLGCYAYSRTDFILGRDGRLYLLEVNTIPGFTSTSLFPQAAARAGISFGELCIKLLELALRREGEKVNSKR